MNDLIQINNDGLTGRLCNPYQRFIYAETFGFGDPYTHENSEWKDFEHTVKSYPVITDTPLVPGSVHTVTLIRQINIGGGWGNRQAGDTKKYPYERQAYQLIEEQPKFTNEEYLDLHGHDDDKYPKYKISTKEYFAMPEEKRRRYSRYSGGNEVYYLLIPTIPAPKNE